MPAQPPKKPNQPPKKPAPAAPAAKAAPPPKREPKLPPPQGPTGVPEVAVEITPPMRRQTITLAETVEIPQQWPAMQSGTMGMLQQAVDFVASGKAVTPDFLANLSRMLGSLEQRMELLNVVFGHHQAHRLQKLHGAIEQVEAIMFNPAQIEKLDPDQAMKLMTTLYQEEAKVTKYLAEQSATPPNPDQVGAAVDPNRVAAQEKARALLGTVPAQTRRAMRDILVKRLAAAQKKTGKG